MTLLLSHAGFSRNMISLYFHCDLSSDAHVVVHVVFELAIIMFLPTLQSVMRVVFTEFVPVNMYCKLVPSM